MIFTHPEFDPVLLHLGPLAIRWYGLMYVFGFIAGFLLGRARIAQNQRRGQPFLLYQDLDNLLLFIALGVILGGRIGYVLFYQWQTLWGQPDILHALFLFIKVWDGGMSFHGGLLGVALALVFFSWWKQKNFFQVTDFIAPLVPPGLFFGRIGNFINGELWGRPTGGDWGMIFPQVDALARHPSQLYQAALEGIFLFVLLWWFSHKPRKTARVTALFLIGYGSVRITTEFFREPDAHLGFVALHWVTMGQILSLPMIAFGLVLWFWPRAKAEQTKTG
jgi:phosphatidylglycerol:prolipoprotein diacylglycerol transferase